MSAADMLNSGQFFHGTDSNAFSVGDTLRPHNKVGLKPNYESFEDHSRNKVFMMDEEPASWEWASMAQETHLRRDPVPKRTWVGRVEPNKVSTQNYAEITADKAKVVERHDIRPGHQGTFPLNWNQFAKKRTGWYGDPLNHPSDRAIDIGHLAAHREETEPPDDFKARRLAEQAEADKIASVRGQGTLF